MKNIFYGLLVSTIIASVPAVSFAGIGGCGGQYVAQSPAYAEFLGNVNNVLAELKKQSETFSNFFEKEETKRLNMEIAGGKLNFYIRSELFDLAIGFDTIQIGLDNLQAHPPYVAYNNLLAAADAIAANGDYVHYKSLVADFNAKLKVLNDLEAQGMLRPIVRH